MGWKHLVLGGVVFLGLRSLGAPPPGACNTSGSRDGSRFEVGLSIESLLPNHLPDFPTTVPIYGLLIGIPLFGHSLQAEGLYGWNNSLTFYNAELFYRYDVETPFFIPFVIAGAHYSHYTFSAIDHDLYGPLFGLGLIIPMGGNFDLSLLMKTYFPNLSIVSFGGGFTMRL